MDILFNIGSNGRLITSYEKRDDLNFAITNASHLCTIAPFSSAYLVYISHLIRYASACYAYQNFLSKINHWKNALLLHGYDRSRWKTSFRKFYGRYTAFAANANHHWAYVEWFNSYLLLEINLVYLISTKGSRRVWPVRKGRLTRPPMATCSALEFIYAF
jgi:hypothetical protein